MKSPSALILLVAFLICFGTLGSIWGWFDNASIPLTSSPTITTATTTESTALYELSVEYPVFSGFGGEQDAALNTKMKSFIDDQISIFKDDTTGQLPSSSERSSLTIRFTPYTIKDDLVSIAFQNAFYASGAAHPGSYTLVFNYLPQSGIFIELPDFLTNEYLHALSAYVRDYLKTELSLHGMSEFQTDTFESGTAPLLVNFQTFTIDENGLEIFIDEYQVGPYALGSFQVPISFADLAVYLRTDAPFRLPLLQ